MNKNMLAAVLLLGVAAVAQAEDAITTRELNQMLSRYDATLARMETQNEKLMSELRSLQREQMRVSKLVEVQQLKVDDNADIVQNLKTTELDTFRTAVKDDMQTLRQNFWGESQRDCAQLGVKHQQIKVTTSPDGTESVRFLCFDGKPLLLGAEKYVVGN